MLGDKQTLHLQGVYNTLYNATTRPDFKFAVTRYFIDEWLPLLGPSMAWLIVGLRQQCFWNQRRDWCIVDKATLARETALDERTIERCLKKPLSHWFVVEITHRYRYRSQIGKKVRDKNRYHLLLDEPLSPRHQIGLTNLLHQMLLEKAESLDVGLAAVQSILTLPDLIDKISYTGKIPKDLPRRTILELVEDALNIRLSDYAADERIAELDRRCAQLYNLIVQPNKIYVGWQYFRLAWVGLLGHALAWLVIYMRRHCFWDETSGELRDHFTAYKKDLAGAIGQTTRNLANLIENPHADLFFTTPKDNETDATANRSRNQPTTYKIRMVDEPLTPADQQQVALELRQRLEGDVFGRDVENGQLNLFPILDRLSSRQNFAYGQVSEKMPLSEAKDRRLVETSPEKMSQHESGANGKNAATLNDSLELTHTKERQKQQNGHAAVDTKGVELLLHDLSVQEPTRSKILANSDITVAKIGAWFLYAETQPGLFDPRSYVIKRLLANDAPPPEFLAFARLDDATWHLFETIIERLRLGQTQPATIAPEFIETFVNWAHVYANLDPAETYHLLTRSEQPALLPPDPLEYEPSASDSTLTLARDQWQATLAQLRLQMAKQTFDNWLKQTEVLTVQDDVFVIDAKNAYAKEWLENRLVKSIERTLTGVVGQPMAVRFVLSEAVGQ